jgi:hypothetical protein
MNHPEQNLITQHELGHIAVMVHQTGHASLYRDEDGFTAVAPPPTDAAQALDRHLAGVFAELISKAKGNLTAARTALEFTGWRVALHSDIASHDLELVGPMLEQPTVLQSFHRSSGVIATALKVVDLKALDAAMMRMQPGQALTFGRPVVH